MPTNSAPPWAPWAGVPSTGVPPVSSSWGSVRGSSRAIPKVPALPGVLPKAPSFSAPLPEPPPPPVLPAPPLYPPSGGGGGSEFGSPGIPATNVGATAPKSFMAPGGGFSQNDVLESIMSRLGY